MLLWANEYLSTQNQLFLTGFQRPDGQSFSHIPKVFNLVFVLANPSFIGLLSPSSILDYRLITLFFAPGPLGDEEIQPWEKIVFVTRRKYACVKVHVCLVPGNWTETERGAFLPDWSQRSIEKRLRYQYIEQDLSQQDIPDAKLESWCTPSQILQLTWKLKLVGEPD